MAEKQKRLINRGRVAALVFLGLLLLLLIFLLWWWFFRSSEEPESEPTVVNTNAIVLPPQGTPVTDPEVIPVVEPPTDGELQIMTLARNFAERYGTYSNQGNFQNLRELAQWSTQSLQRDFNTIISNSETTPGYYGVDTKVINITINEQSATEAEVTVMTQRAFTGTNTATIIPDDPVGAFDQGTGQPEVTDSLRYQALDLTMVNLNDYWYVDTATWQ